MVSIRQASYINLEIHSPMRKRILLIYQFLLIIAISGISQSFDPNFQPNITRPGDVQQLMALPDGRFLAAGSFTLANDLPEANIARFFADGSIDLSFQSSLQFSITAMDLQPDGKIVIGGSYTNSSAPDGITVLRLHPDGSLDNTFQAGFAPSGTIEALKVEFNGTILIGGAFHTFAGQAAQGLARLAPEGFLLQTIQLEPTGTVFISDLIVLDNGRFYVAGTYGPEGYLSYRNYSGIPNNDFSFTPYFEGINNLMVGIRDIELDSEGNIILTAGTFLIRYALAIINPDGSMQDWGYIYGIPMDIAVDGFDNILVAGEYEGVNAIHRFIPGQELTIYNGGAGCDGLIRQLEVHPNGTYLIGGAFSSFNGQEALSLEHLDGFGNPISGFDPTLERPGIIRSSAVVNDKIYIAGDFVKIGEHYSPNLARIFLSNGQADLTFSNPGLSYRNTINHLALDGQNRILLAGTNEYDGDTPEESPIVRVLSNGAIDPSFNVDPLPVGTISKVVPIPGGLIMAAGDFTMFDPDIIAGKAAVFTSNGTLLTNFTNRFSATSVTEAFRQNDGKLILAGKELSYDDSSPQSLLRLTATFDIDNSFQPPANIQCSGNCRYTLSQQVDGRLLLGGDLYPDSETALVRLNNDGSLDNSFNFPHAFSDLGSFADGRPRAIRPFPNGRILMVGLYDSLGTQPVRGMSILEENGNIIETFDDLSFDRQNIYGASVLDDNTFTIHGSLVNASPEVYASIAIVDYTPPVPNTISGALNAWWGPAISNVELGLLGTTTGNALSADNGFYEFSNVEENGAYEVIPMLNIDPLNGISTMDMIMISQHILGVSVFTNPYQLIAADANNSNSITVLDMLTIRKLILGLTTNFENTTSWRFVPESYTFPINTNPWLEAFPESATITNLVAPGANDIHFVGIKTGDVSGDAETDNFLNTDGRQALHLSSKDQKIQAGGLLQIPINAESLEDILGLQFTISYDPRALELSSIEHGVTNDQNFGIQWTNNGLITFSWNAMDGTTISENETLFHLRFKSLVNGQLSDHLTINSAFTKAEAYNSSLDVHPVALTFQPTEENSDFSVLSIYPNPFSSQAKFRFVLPEEGNVILRCYNNQGQLIAQDERYFSAGNNHWILKRENFNSGLLSYELIFGDKRWSGKVVVE